MAASQRKLREIIFQIIYSRDANKASGSDLLDLIVKNLKVSKKTAQLAEKRALLIEERFEQIDEKMRLYLNAYRFDRISRVEKNILRLGFFEIFHDQDIPSTVAIAEAIRLCRKFGSIEGAKFVNAILDGSCKHQQQAC